MARKYTNNRLIPFIEKGLNNLTVEERFNLFKIMKAPITFAIKKAYSKFDSIPLEEEDFGTTSWIAFDSAVQNYTKKCKRKKFISYIIDAIYWNTLDMCIKYTSNKHKVLNLSLESFNENRPMEEESTYLRGSKIAEKTALYDAVDKHFEKTRDPNEKVIFFDFVNGMSKNRICEKYTISRNKLLRIITNAQIQIKKSLI